MLTTINENRTIKEKNYTILQMKIEATCIINVKSPDSTFIAERSLRNARSDGVKTFLRSNSAVVLDCYIAEISKNLIELIPIGPDVRLTEYESD